MAALGGVLHIELALCQYLYGYVDSGRQYLGRAGQLLGVEPQLTGMGPGRWGGRCVCGVPRGGKRVMELDNGG